MLNNIYSNVVISAFSLLVSFTALAGSACSKDGLTGQSLGLCTAFCDAMDCTADGNKASCDALRAPYLKATGSVSFPCEQVAKTCALVSPEDLYQRMSIIFEPDHICYADTNQIPYSYVEYIVDSGGTPQIGMGMEDQFDGTWYGYYFEYQGSPDGSLAERFRYDLTPAEVQACREAFEPPFKCPE